WCLFVMTGAPKLNKIQRNKAGIHEPDTEQIIHCLEPFSVTTSTLSYYPLSAYFTQVAVY
ncbi:hypothetical protein, partial [Thiolapillus sp.]|uniref:hypothetical protein n=1 Tax=Thiolapillus sp. TaxID=2017437 RepID=UPI003AF61260